MTTNKLVSIGTGDEHHAGGRGPAQGPPPPEQLGGGFGLLHGLRGGCACEWIERPSSISNSSSTFLKFSKFIVLHTHVCVHTIQTKKITQKPTHFIRLFSPPSLKQRLTRFKFNRISCADVQMAGIQSKARSFNSLGFLYYFPRSNTYIFFYHIIFSWCTLRILLWLIWTIFHAKFAELKRKARKEWKNILSQIIDSIKSPLISFVCFYYPLSSKS